MRISTFDELAYRRVTKLLRNMPKGRIRRRFLLIRKNLKQAIGM